MRIRTFKYVYWYTNVFLSLCFMKIATKSRKEQLLFCSECANNAHSRLLYCTHRDERSERDNSICAHRTRPKHVYIHVLCTMRVCSYVYWCETLCVRCEVQLNVYTAHTWFAHMNVQCFDLSHQMSNVFLQRNNVVVSEKDINIQKIFKSIVTVNN